MLAHVHGAFLVLEYRLVPLTQQFVLSQNTEPKHMRVDLSLLMISIMPSRTLQFLMHNFPFEPDMSLGSLLPSCHVAES